MKQEPVAWVDKIWMERPDLVKNYLDIGKLFMRVGEGVENYVPLYTEPQYRELNYYELGELYVQAEKESLRMARVKPEGGISLSPVLVRFAELVLKKASEK